MGKTNRYEHWDWDDTAADNGIVEVSLADTRLGDIISLLAEIESDSSRYNQKLEQLSESIGGIDKLSKNVNELLRFRTTINSIVDKLYKQMNSQKEDPRYKILKPLLKDLILFHDDLLAIKDKAGDELGEDNDITHSISTLHHGLIEILYRVDVEEYDVADDDALDISRQKTVGVLHTDDPGMDKKVIEVKRRGFVWQPGILRREEVVIAKYCKDTDEDEDDANADVDVDEPEE